MCRVPSPAPPCLQVSILFTGFEDLMGKREALPDTDTESTRSPQVITTASAFSEDFGSAPVK